MSLSDITVADSSATSTTFALRVKNGLTATFRKVGTGDPAMLPHASLKLRPASRTAPQRKVGLQIAIPHLNTAGETVYASAHVELLVHESIPVGVSEDLLAFVTGFASDAIVKAVVTDEKFN